MALFASYCFGAAWIAWLLTVGRGWFALADPPLRFARWFPFEATGFAALLALHAVAGAAANVLALRYALATEGRRRDLAPYCPTCGAALLGSWPLETRCAGCAVDAAEPVSGREPSLVAHALAAFVPHAGLFVLHLAALIAFEKARL